MADLPPLSALPAFEATTRLGAMSAAAAELGRTHSAVSKQIAHLEAALGRRLFERDGQGVRPTQEGADYAEAVREALSLLRRATRRLTAPEARRPLTVRLSGALAARWLIPRLPEFQARRPEIEVGLSVTAGGAAFGREPGDWDVLLSWDRLTRPLETLRAEAGPAARTRILGDAAFGPVCAPGLLWETEEGEVLGDRILHAEIDLWTPWASATGRRIGPGATRVLPNTALCAEAALAGMGAALVERRLVADALEAGRLTAPLGFLTLEGGFAAVLRRPSRRADAFLDWLAER